MGHVLGYTIIAIMIWAIAMTAQVSGFDASNVDKARRTSGSPIAMLELADSEQRFMAILDQGEREKNTTIVRVNTYMDFIFVILYCLLFSLLALVLSPTSNLATAVIIAILIAGLLDYWENVRLLRQLRRVAPDGSEGSLPRPVSLSKWALFAVSLWLLAILMLEAKSHLGQGAPLLVMMVFVFLAAACATVGLFRNALVGASVLCLFPALIAAAWIWNPWH